MSRTFRITVAYDGTEFAGWQVQPNQRTIQDCLEKATESITGERPRIIGSGRTDAGVHALAQVASCRLQTWKAPADALGRALNTQLPSSIVVHRCEDADDDFHAIASATSKRYRYQIQIGGNRDPHLCRTWWRVQHDLDINAMTEAANRIVGEKDYASFQASGAVVSSTIRNVTGCDLIELSSPVNCDTNPCHLVAIEVEANGFLYNMVRNIVGTLVEVGRGKHAPTWIDQVIAAKNRDAAGPTSPANGLFLKWVAYSNWRSDGNQPRQSTHGAN